MNKYYRVSPIALFVLCSSILIGGLYLNHRNPPAKIQKVARDTIRMGGNTFVEILKGDPYIGLYILDNSGKYYRNLADTAERREGR